MEDDQTVLPQDGVDDTANDIDDFLQDIEAWTNRTTTRSAWTNPPLPKKRSSPVLLPARAALAADGLSGTADSGDMDSLADRIARLEQGIAQFEALEDRFFPHCSTTWNPGWIPLREHGAATADVPDSALDENALAERIASSLEESLGQRLEALLTDKVESAVSERIDAASALLRSSLMEEIRSEIERAVPEAAPVSFARKSKLWKKTSKTRKTTTSSD